MKQLELGDTGLKLSQLGLGTVKFGRNQGVKYPNSFEIPGEDQLDNLLQTAKSLGINCLDTAPAYGTSEERLGRLLQNQRNDWIIIGKVGEEFNDGQSEYIFTPNHFKMSIERSLKRLKTDVIDILLIHSDGNDIEVLNNDILIQTMHNFKSQGIVKAIGASTKTVEGGIKTLELMDIAMCMYNPDYTDEKPVLDYAHEHNKGIILKKVLGSGHTTTPAQSLQYALSHPCNPCAIVGTINEKHLRDNVNAITKD